MLTIGSLRAEAAAERTDMAAPSDTKPRSRQKTGVYVYGILPGDVELTSDIQGIGDPPGQVELVRSGQLAALVSEVDLSRSLGTPKDLQTHEEILDSTAVGSPVLPLRFGAVLASEDAVVEELLEPHRDEFAAALAELEGRTEYLVKGRYVERTILQEILSENSEAAELAEQVRDQDPDATRDLRIRLGELINNAIAAEREEDTRLLVSRVADHVAASFVREPTHELDAVYAAFLVEEDQEEELERAVQDMAREWEGRVELSLRGPLAPWDFVGSRAEPQD
jgi:Gas vesicle synthesis protein GvpL/GvpF